MSDPFAHIRRIAKEIASLAPSEREGKGERTKNAYQDLWSKCIDGITRQIEQGEGLAHILFTLRPPPHKARTGNRVARQIVEELRAQAGLDPKDTQARLLASPFGYALSVNFSPTIELVGTAKAATNIVELGSGPGWNLLELSIALGKSASEKRFFALEYTDAGLQVSDLLARHPDAPPLSSHSFDYTAPDISMVPDDGPTLFFSQHSIEQVEDISPTLYADIIARRSPSTIIHLEPIGWQRYPEMLKPRMKDDTAFLEALIASRLEHSGSLAVAVNAAINAWRQGYNRNAYALLMKKVNAGKLTLDEAVYDFTWERNSNPVNPTTFLRLSTPR